MDKNNQIIIETTLYVTIKVVVETTEEMKISQFIDEFERECNYNIIGCEGIKVINTKYLKTSL